MVSSTRLYLKDVYSLIKYTSRWVHRLLKCSCLLRSLAHYVNFPAGTVHGTITLLQLPPLFHLVPEDAPNSLTAVNITSRSLTVLWAPPVAEYWNGVIRYYLVGVTETETGEKLQYTSNSPYLDLDHLHPYYTYSFVIRANTIGLGPSSGALRVQTLEDGQLLLLQIHQQRCRSVQV